MITRRTALRSCAVLMLALLFAAPHTASAVDWENKGSPVRNDFYDKSQVCFEIAGGSVIYLATAVKLKTHSSGYLTIRIHLYKFQGNKWVEMKSDPPLDVDVNYRWTMDLSVNSGTPYLAIGGGYCTTGYQQSMVGVYKWAATRWLKENSWNGADARIATTREGDPFVYFYGPHPDLDESILGLWVMVHELGEWRMLNGSIGPISGGSVEQGDILIGSDGGIYASYTWYEHVKDGNYYRQRLVVMDYHEATSWKDVGSAYVGNFMAMATRDHALAISTGGVPYVVAEYGYDTVLDDRHLSTSWGTETWKFENHQWINLAGPSDSAVPLVGSFPGEPSICVNQYGIPFVSTFWDQEPYVNMGIPSSAIWHQVGGRIPGYSEPYHLRITHGGSLLGICQIYSLSNPSLQLVGYEIGPINPQPPGRAEIDVPTGDVYTPNPIFGWSRVDNATWYRLDLGKDDYAYTTQWFDTWSWTPSWDLPAGRYNWTVTTWNEYGFGPTSTNHSFQIMVGPPAGTWGLTPDGVITERQPEFTWVEADRALWYRIILYRSGEVIYDEWIEGIESWQPPAGLPAGRYIWKVMAANGYGQSDWSGGTWFEIQADLPGSVFGFIPSGLIEEWQPVFTWSESQGADWYKLSVQHDGVMIYSTYITNGLIWMPPDDLTSGQYTWWVAGGNVDGLGPWSDAVNFEVPSLTPDILTGLRPSGTTGNRRPVFEWSSDSRATVYRLYMKRNDLAYEDTFIENGETWQSAVDMPYGDYTWWIVGWNPNGYGPWSSTMSFSVSAPVLEIGPTSLSNSCSHGIAATDQTIEVWNDATESGVFFYTVTDDADWLSVSPVSGGSTGEHDTVTVQYQTADLAIGTHRATITIAAAGAIGSPRVIPVQVDIVQPPSLSKLWDRRFGGSQEDTLLEIIRAADGGYVLAGSSLSDATGDKTEASRGSLDYWIVKITRTGQKLWDKRYGGSEGDRLRSILQTSDSGYILAGTTASGAGGDITEASKGKHDCWIVKVSSTGQKQWDRRYGGSDYDSCYEITQAPDGGYVLAGASMSPADGDKTEASRGSYDCWVLKIDANGNKQWDRTYGGTESDSVHAAITTSDGGCLLGGYTYSDATGDVTEATRGGNDYWIVKIDSTGNKQWDRRYGGASNDICETVVQTTDGGYLLGGDSWSGAEGDKSEPSRGVRDYWLVKIDSTGKKQWDKRYGGGNIDLCRSVIQTLDGGFAVGGTACFYADGDDQSEPHRGSADQWIVKLDSNGNKEWDRRYGGWYADYCEALLQIPTGEYILAGYSLSGVDGDKSESTRGKDDFWIVCQTPDGPASITASAGPNGSISPSGVTQVPKGASQDFAIFADSSYFISSITTPDGDLPCVAGLNCYTARIENVSDDGSIQAAFASVAETMAINNTPIPWLRSHYPAAPNLYALVVFAGMDTDGDSRDGWQEYAAGTGPSDSSDVFKLQQAGPARDTAGFTMRWQSATGRLYTVRHSDDLLGVWTNVCQLIGTGGVMSYTNNDAQRGKGFFNLQVARWTPASSAPGQVSAVAPDGETKPSGAIEYIWQGDPRAEWYRLWITLDGEPWHDEWHNAGYFSGTASWTVAGHAAGTYVWCVLGWNDYGFGSWSVPTTFTVQ